MFSFFLVLLAFSWRYLYSCLTSVNFVVPFPKYILFTCWFLNSFTCKQFLIVCRSIFIIIVANNVEDLIPGSSTSSCLLNQVLGAITKDLASPSGLRQASPRSSLQHPVSGVLIVKSREVLWLPWLGCVWWCVCVYKRVKATHTPRWPLRRHRLSKAMGPAGVCVVPSCEWYTTSQTDMVCRVQLWVVHN